MKGFGKATLMGNIVADPELRQTSNGKSVVGFTVAINDKKPNGDEETTFVDVTAWEGLADVIAEYKVKGDPIYVEGKLRMERWQAKDGSNRSKLSVTARDVVFLPKGGEEGTSQASSSRSSSAGSSSRVRNAQRQASAAATDPEDDFDDIPFHHLPNNRIVTEVL